MFVTHAALFRWYRPSSEAIDSPSHLDLTIRLGGSFGAEIFFKRLTSGMWCADDVEDAKGGNWDPHFVANTP